MENNSLLLCVFFYSLPVEGWQTLIVAVDWRVMAETMPRRRFHWKIEMVRCECWIGYKYNQNKRKMSPLPHSLKPGEVEGNQGDMASYLTVPRGEG